MSQVYQDALSLPLRGAREVSRVSVGEDVKIIRLDGPSFEGNWRLFWFVFEWSLGWFLAKHIEHKSFKIALRHCTNPESFVDSNGNGDFLHQARQAFGRNRIPELFRLRTAGFNATSPLMQHFCENVAMASALDDVYNALSSYEFGGRRLYPLSAPPDFWSNFYLSCPNAQAVRNRYRLVTWQYLLSGGGRTLSIACGSAQPLLDALRTLKMCGRADGSHLTLTDSSEESLELARLRATEAGVIEQVSFLRVPFKKLASQLQGEKFDVIEACGIFDYLSDEQVVELLRFVLGSLTPAGRIIVSNMNKTRGANVLSMMYNWSICYRTPEQLGRLIRSAGGRDVQVLVEPWGIHPVAIASI